MELVQASRPLMTEKFFSDLLRYPGEDASSHLGHLLEYPGSDERTFSDLQQRLLPEGI